MDNVKRYLAPILIVILTLPSAGFGISWLVALIASHYVSNPKSDPSLLLLSVIQFSFYIFIVTWNIVFLKLEVPLVLSCMLWVWLLIGKNQMTTKLWTAILIIIAFYGRHVLLYSGEWKVR